MLSQKAKVGCDLEIKGLGLTMRNSKATVCEDFKGNVTILYKGKKMNYTAYRRAEKRTFLLCVDRFDPVLAV